MCGVTRVRLSYGSMVRQHLASCDKMIPNVGSGPQVPIAEKCEVDLVSNIRRRFPANGTIRVKQPFDARALTPKEALSQFG